MDVFVAAVTSVVSDSPYSATTTPLDALESSTVEHHVSFTGVFGTVVSHGAPRSSSGAGPLAAAALDHAINNENVVMPTIALCGRGRLRCTCLP